MSEKDRVSSLSVPVRDSRFWCLHLCINNPFIIMLLGNAGNFLLQFPSFNSYADGSYVWENSWDVPLFCWRDVEAYFYQGMRLTRACPDKRVQNHNYRQGCTAFQ